MSIYNRKTAIRNLIIAIVLCIALLAASLAVCINKYLSTNPLFEDDDFAAAIANALGINARDVDQSILDKYQTLIYYADIGVDTKSMSSYAYPVVILADEFYTDLLIADELDSEKDYSDHFIACIHIIEDSSDLLLFRNLRYLSALDTTNVYNMQINAYYTQLYSSYVSAISADSVIDSICLDDLTSFNQLASLEKLEYLAVEYTGIKTLAGVDKFKNLTSLDIGCTSITSLDGIQGCTELETLMAAGLEISDVSPLAGNVKLTGLDLSSNKIEDISALSELTALEKLALSDNSIMKIDALSKLTSLKTLYISNNNDITKLDGIANATKLETLDVSDTRITSLNALEKLTELTTLSAYNSENEGLLSDIKGIKNLTKLTTLSINGNKELKSLEGLEGCTELTTLNASKCAIEDASPISKLTKATTINLSENKLTSIVDAVKGLNKLTSLNLSKNDITSISGIESAFEKDFAGTVTITDNKNLEVLKDAEGKAIDLKKVYEKATFTGLATESDKKDDTSGDTSDDTSKAADTSSSESSNG